MIGLSAVLAGAALVVYVVGRGETEASWGTAAFTMKVSGLERRNECEKAIRELNRVRATNDPEWYEWLVALQLECFTKTKQRQYLEEALSVVSDGASRFPRSSRLLFLKGSVNGRLGEWGLQRRYFEAALKLAKDNIAADPGGTRTADDRAIAAAAESNLETMSAPQ